MKSYPYIVWHEISGCVNEITITNKLANRYISIHQNYMMEIVGDGEKISTLKKHVRFISFKYILSRGYTNATDWRRKMYVYGSALIDSERPGLFLGGLAFDIPTDES